MEIARKRRGGVGKVGVDSKKVDGGGDDDDDGEERKPGRASNRENHPHKYSR